MNTQTKPFVVRQREVPASMLTSLRRALRRATEDAPITAGGLVEVAIAASEAENLMAGAEWCRRVCEAVILAEAREGNIEALPSGEDDEGVPLKRGRYKWVGE